MENQKHETKKGIIPIWDGNKGTLATEGQGSLDMVLVACYYFGSADNTKKTENNFGKTWVSFAM
jgi:hypothetical protein